MSIISNFKVSVRCMTYNHAPYIEDAMNGFTMQQTNFPFVCTIVDDASTDGEQEVIKLYLQEHFDLDNNAIAKNEDTDDYTMIFAQHKVNKQCYFAVYYLKYNHYSINKDKIPYLTEWNTLAKYTALCEGDDYWINSKKLQSQVDILDNNKNCSLVVTNGMLRFGDDLKYDINPIACKESHYLSMGELLMENGDFALIPTASMCFRNSIAQIKPKEFASYRVGDRPLRYWLGINGTVYYDITKTIVYRRNSLGSFSQAVSSDKEIADKVCKSFCEFCDFFDNYTHFKYHTEVDYVKNREKYSFYARIGDKKSMVESNFFKTFPIKKRIKIRLKLFFEIKFPKITKLLKCIIRNEVK